MTSQNGNIYPVTGHFAGNSPVTGEFPAQRPVTLSFGNNSDAGDLRRPTNSISLQENQLFALKGVARGCLIVCIVNDGRLLKKYSKKVEFLYVTW